MWPYYHGIKYQSKLGQTFFIEVFFIALKKQMSLRKPWRYRGSWGTAPLTLNLGNRRKCVLISTPWPLGPRGKRPGTHGTEDWVGPRAAPGTLENGKLSLPCRKSNDDSSVIQAVAWPLRRWYPYLTASLPLPTSEYIHDFPKRKENHYLCLSQETVINTSREDTQRTLTTHNTPSVYVFFQ
jgi:hypothetical protein